MKQEKNTALALLRSAERLFATRGVDAVSLREVAAAAGQRNHSAALYHFGDKRGLLNALLERHSNPIQAGWLVTLEHVQAEGRGTLEELVGLLVRPLVAKLDDPDGGADYLRIVAQLVNSSSFPITEMPAANAPGIVALSGAIVERAGDIPLHLLPLRMLSVAGLLYGSIASYLRLTTIGVEIPRQDFVDDLIQSLVRLLGAPAQRPE